MIQGILRVNDGGVYYSKGLEAFLYPAKSSNNLHSPSKFDKDPSELLTKKEIKIIELVSQGLRNKQIALSLGINVRTAESYVSNILSKLGVSKRFEAVLYWASVNKETLS